MEFIFESLPDRVETERRVPVFPTRPKGGRTLRDHRKDPHPDGITGVETRPTPQGSVTYPRRQISNVRGRTTDVSLFGRFLDQLGRKGEHESLCGRGHPGVVRTGGGDGMRTGSRVSVSIPQ